MVFTLPNEFTLLFYLLQYSQSGLVRYYARNQCRQCPTLPLIFSFLQFDFVISLRDAKEILDTILTCVQIPDYYPEGILDPLMGLHSVKVTIFEEGPRLSHEAIFQKTQNYSKLLHALVIPTWLFMLFKEFKVQLSYNDVYNHFFTPLYPVTSVQAEGFFYFDSVYDYYTYHLLM